MGLTYAEIELTNTRDIVLAQSGHLAQENVRHMQVNALVDSGAWLLTINDDIKNQLGLPVIDKSLAELADGTIVETDIVGPVDVRFQNRRVTADAMVLPDATEPLLGAIPMEGMDVLIDPKQQKLIVNPKTPYKRKFAVK
jgi:clan AA aspartic protease